jgi:hypothetical protein
MNSRNPEPRTLDTAWSTRPTSVGEADAGAIGWMVYLGVFPTALAFTTWAYALARTGAGRMGAITYLVPPISVVLGWLLLGGARLCSRSSAAPCACSASSSRG